MMTALGEVARYYHFQGYKFSTIEGKLEDYIIKCDPCANIVKLQGLIERQAKKAGKRKMIEINEVPISKKELNEISKLGSRSKQKVAFAALCLAKYYNLVNPQNNGWVNKDIKEIFTLANVGLSKAKQDDMLNDLMSAGYLVSSKIVGNLNFRVTHMYNEEPEIMITDYRNLGNQYLMYNGENYIPCDSCGLVIKRNRNVQKYCKKCAFEIERLRER